jgi:excisionase family DNA binding protein
VTGATTDGRLLTTREAAALLQLDPAYTARLCQAGKLGAVRVGKQYRVPESTALAYLQRPSCTRRGRQGKWVPVADALRKLIADLQPGDKLPGLKALGAEHGTSVTPPGTAYRELEAEGLVRMVPGSGFYVRELP